MMIGDYNVVGGIALAAFIYLMLEGAFDRRRGRMINLRRLVVLAIWTAALLTYSAFGLS